MPPPTKSLIGKTTLSLCAVYGIYRYLKLDTHAVVQLMKFVLTAFVSKVTVPICRFLEKALGSVPLRPSNPSNLTAQFVQWVLNNQGYSGSKVKSIFVKPFDAGKTSKTVRISIEYDATQPKSINPPSSLVCKMNREDIEGRVFNLVAGLYREASFYKSYAKSCGLEVPNVLYSYVDTWFSCDFVIIMEDLSPAKTIIEADTLRPYFTEDKLDNSWSMDIDLVESCITNLIPFHNKFASKNEEIADLPWVINVYRNNYEKLNLFDFYFKTGWKKTKAQQARGEWLSTPWPNSYVAVVDEFVSNFKALVLDDEHLNFPRTLCHGDFHGMNILKTQSNRLVVVDFQILSFAPGLFDVGYFLIGALSPSERRKHDRRLVKLYYDGLKKLGNHLEDETTLPFELFYQRYLVGAFFKHVLLVINSATIMADGKEEDFYLVPWIHHRLKAFLEDHKDIIGIWRKSTAWRRRLLIESGRLQKSV